VTTAKSLGFSMIMTDNKGRFLVECHFPLNFVRLVSHSLTNWQDTFWHAYAEWRDAINGVQLVPDKRRYGVINTSHLMFWIESTGPIIYKNRFTYHQKYAPAFEMYIRTSINSNAVSEALNGWYGKHFFLVNMQLDPKSTPCNVFIKRFLTPVLMAQSYPGYECAMDKVFADLAPFFQGDPDSTLLPTMALRY
jgi:hypothetical protein